MIKRLLSIFILIFIIALPCISSFAAEADKKDADKSKPLISVTKPAAEVDKVYSTKNYNTYTISGLTDFDNIKIELYKRNADGSFREFKDENGQNSWEVGPSGFFSIDVALSSGYKNNPGINNFKLKAFDKTNPELSYSTTFTIYFIDVSKKKPDTVNDYTLDKFLKPSK